MSDILFPYLCGAIPAAFAIGWLIGQHRQHHWDLKVWRASVKKHNDLMQKITDLQNSGRKE